MSSNDSGRPPPNQPRRRVLRKIATGSEPPSAAPPDRASSIPRARPSTPAPTDSSDPFDLLANPQRAPSGLDRMLQKSAPSVYPPSAAPAPSAPSLEHVVQLPSFDTSAPGTPPPSRTRGSLPPVVASVSEQRPAAQAPAAPATSVRKAGLVGASLGLAFVAMFVIGARLAYRPTSQVAAETTALASATAMAPSASSPIPVASTVAPAPTPAATELTFVIQSPPRRAASASRANSPPAPAGKQATPPAAASEADTSTSGAATLSRAAPATSLNSGTPADTAGSRPLVPVLPSAGPPELDPLVKAVLEEDQPPKK